MKLKIINKKDQKIEAHVKVRNINEAKKFIDLFSKNRCEYYLGNTKLHVNQKNK